MHSFKYIALTSILFISVACKKDKIEELPAADQFNNGLLLINEGLFQQNNASLSWIDLQANTSNNLIFEQKNGRLLGDVANDILRYGNKIYITVSTSSTLEIIDAQNGKSIQQINMVENGIPKQPREIKAFNGKVFVSCFDGFVDVIDTLNFELVQRIPVGSNPEALTQKDGKLYVSNTGGLNFPLVDSTVSVIDMTTLTELNRIVVGKNPGPSEFDNEGNFYVVTARANDSYNTQLVRFHANTYVRDTIYLMNITKIEKMNNQLLVLQSNYSSTALHLYDCSTRAFVQQNFIPSSYFHTLYNIQYDAIHQQILCFDAVGFTNLGYVNLFSSNGNFLKKIQTGLCPTKAIIYE